MRKSAVVTILFCLSLFARDFRTFEKEVSSDALELKMEALRQKMESIKTTLPLYDKPIELELFASEYKERTYETGGSMGIKIPILLNEKELHAIATARHKRGRLLVRYAKAKFLKQLELLYSDYVYSVKKEKIATQNITLARKILRLVQKRYEARAATKKDLFRLRAVVIEAKKEALQARRNRERARMALQSFAQKEIDCTPKFLYETFDEKKGIGTLPFRILELAIQEALQQKKKVSKKLRRIDLVLEYEKEPDQDIYRAGVAIPFINEEMVREQKHLAIMQERALKLELRKNRYKLTTQLETLKQNAKLLQTETKESQALLSQEREALRLIVKSYELRAATITELLQARRSLLKAQHALLQSRYELQKRIIQIRFIQGAYDG